MPHLDDFEVAKFFGPACTPSLRARVLEEIAGCEPCRRLVVTLARGRRVEAPSDPLQRYAFEEHLGSGAWGSVHRAHDTVLKRDVAIKLVHDASSKLAREGRLLARCEHPNAVRLFDVVPLGDDVALVMELMSGGTLEAWLSTRPDADEIIARFRAAGRGLAAAHAAGVVHGDFKARNVLLDGARVAVADFGLGHVELAQQTEQPLDSLIEPTWGGTPGYLAPERLRGGPATTASDQYAFGMALRRALGHPPPRIRRAIARMTRPAPGARYPSMDAALDALTRSGPRWVALGLAGVPLAIAGLAVAALAPAHGSGPNAPPRTPPRTYDRDDPQRYALSLASDFLERRAFESVLEALEQGFDLSKPRSSLHWARAANFAAKAHGRLGNLDEQQRLAAAAADVAVEVEHDGLAAEATLALLASQLDGGYSPKMRDLLRKAKAHSDRALAEPGNDDADFRIDLEVELARAAVLAGDGDFDASLATLGVAIERAIGSLGPRASILYRLYELRAKLRQHVGDDDGAGADARAMIELVEDTLGPNSRDLTVPLRTLVFLASKDGDYDRALEYANRSVAVVQDEPPLVLARALVARGDMHAIVRNLAEAEADLERAQEIFERQGSRVDRSGVAMSLARLRAWQDRPEDALRLLERAQVIAEEAGRVDMVARVDLERCRIHKGTGQSRAASKACDAAEAGYVEAFGADHPAKAELEDLRDAQ